ncbi:hypothetical protein B5M42_005910 [Paenibacillus athensensis]|uniref:Uncharacterized protein n=1 Tax=Paenibacillus athensensis TaxID=1967502 RepID=A0A4Y8Q3J6_9BACL|nr:hypothetical protein [Paenibacillus athensensis]MCD1258375.1 hypothetical protein [Paenibacillus athensensis]
MVRLASQRKSHSQASVGQRSAVESRGSQSAETIPSLQLTPDKASFLQRTIGNRAVAQLFRSAVPSASPALRRSKVPSITARGGSTGSLSVQRKYDPKDIPYKTEESLIEKANQLYQRREKMIDDGDVSGVFIIGGDFEELREIARANGWLKAYQLLIKWGEMAPFDKEEKIEAKLMQQIDELKEEIKGLDLDNVKDQARAEDIQTELEFIERRAGKYGWNHIIRYARLVGNHPPFKKVVYANPDKEITNGIDSDALDYFIKSDVPNPVDALGIVKLLKQLTSESKKEPLIKAVGDMESVIVDNSKLQTKEEANILKSFINTYKVAQDKKFNLQLTVKMLSGVVTTGLKRRTQSPEINVTGVPFNPKMPEKQDFTGIHMTEVENQYDVLARKSGSPEKDGSLIPGAVHEVDLAFLNGMRGIPDYRATLTDKEPQIGGGDGGGEKVYALGHTGAINFEGELSNRGGARLYGVMFPKGFMDKYGLDLRTQGISGKSAQTPVDQDFAQGYMYDDKEQTHRVDIPSTKAFAIRAEDNTPDGQAHIHFGRSNMKVHGKKMSQLDFMRSFVTGVVEFNMQGFVINIKYFS